jgi:hypothetical protein
MLEHDFLISSGPNRHKHFTVLYEASGQADLSPLSGVNFALIQGSYSREALSCQNRGRGKAVVILKPLKSIVASLDAVQHRASCIDYLMSNELTKYSSIVRI